MAVMVTVPSTVAARPPPGSEPGFDLVASMATFGAIGAAPGACI
jgi:hypothetical protein